MKPRYVVKSTISAILLITISFGISAQSFEGKITYRLSVESKDTTKVSPSQINMMFNDADTMAVLYISNNRFKMITLNRATGEPRVINQYDPATKTIYDYMYNSEFVIESGNATLYEYRKKKHKKDGQKVLLDENCAVDKLTYSNVTIFMWHSPRFPVDPETIHKDAPSFLQFIRQIGRIPLKFTMSSSNTVHKLVYEALSISRESVPDYVFDHPTQKK